MSWANIVSKNIPKEAAVPAGAAQPTKSAQVKGYDSDFPAFNNQQSAKPQQQQQQQQQQVVEAPVAVACAPFAPPVTENDGFQESNQKRRSNEGDDHPRDRKPSFNKEKRNNDEGRPHYQRDRNQSGGDDRPRSNNNRDRRPPRHQNADDQAGERPKFDHKAKKLEEEQQLRERFKDQAASLCFKEVTGDLFSVDDSVSLAHCVSADMEMSRGIAVEFKSRFGRVDELLNHYPRPGKCSFIRDDQRYVFYLVTKRYYAHKPTYKALEDSLKSMQALCDKFRVTQLAMPRIGCGLDLLEWDLVSRIIDDVFAKTNIQISVYSIESTKK